MSGDEGYAAPPFPCGSVRGLGSPTLSRAGLRAQPGQLGARRWRRAAPAGSRSPGYLGGLRTGLGTGSERLLRPRGPPSSVHCGGGARGFGRGARRARLWGSGKVRAGLRGGRVRAPLRPGRTALGCPRALY